MSLDVYLERVQPTEVFHANVTHNLNKMAVEADLYDCLWRPDEYGYATSAQVAAQLRIGLALLKAAPERFKRFNPANGWGDYDGLVRFVEKYLAACEEYPDATVRVSR